VKGKTPHVIPYQGSKRKLAEKICRYFPTSVGTLYEPFAGSAAISIFSAHRGLTEKFVIGDILEPLVNLQKLIIEEPEEVATGYERIWKAQGKSANERYDYFFSIRETYNAERNPILLLFLIARCVANAVRFSKNGNFTQSPDKRRMGTTPSNMRQNIYSVSALLRGKCSFFIGDYAECVRKAKSSDLVYLDPPYRGTTEGSDKRYFQQVETRHLIDCLEELNRKNVPFILSYDGSHGEKRYGDDLPEHLECRKLLLDAGRSTQGTLNGREVHTIESLYVSKKIVTKLEPQPELLLA